MSAVSSGPVALPFESLLLSTPAILGIRLGIAVTAMAATPIRFVATVVNLQVSQPPIRLVAQVAPQQLSLVLLATVMSEPEVLGLYADPVQRPALGFQ